MLPVALVIFVALFAASLAGYATARAALQRQIEARAEATSRQTLASVEAYLRARVAELDSMVFQQLKNPALTNRQRELVLYNYDFAFGQTRYVDLTILDPKGHVVVSTGAPRIEPTAPWLGRAEASTQAGLADFQSFSDQARPLLVVYAPIIDDGERRLGLLVGRLQLDELAAIVRGAALDPQSSLFLVRDGKPLIALSTPGGPAFAAAIPLVSETAAQTAGPLNAGLSVVSATDARAAYAPVRALAWEMLLLALAIFIVAAAVTWQLAQHIAAPVRRVAEAAHALAGGQLETTVDHERLREEELRDLAMGFNVMAQTLRSLIAGIQTASHTIAESVRFNLDAGRSVQEQTEAQTHAAEAIAGAIGQLAAGARQVSLRALELEERSHGGLRRLDELVKRVDRNDATLATLATALQQASAAGRALAGDAERVAAHAHSVGERVERVEHLAEDARSATQALVGETSRMTEVLLDTVARLRELASAGSETIQAQLGLMHELAERSKLLALNAAIEAARAGAHGRGFFVIAEELQRLTAQSQAAADEISLAVRRSQHETNAIALQTQGAERVAHEAVNRAGSAGDAIERLVAEVAAGFAGANEISRIAAEQAQRTLEIERVTVDVLAMAREAAEAVGATAALTREVRESVTLATGVAEDVALTTRDQLSAFSTIEHHAQRIVHAAHGAHAAAESALTWSERLRGESERLESRVADFLGGEGQSDFGSSSSTGMPLGSSTNAIQRVPPGDFLGPWSTLTPSAFNRSQNAGKSPSTSIARCS